MPPFLGGAGAWDGEIVLGTDVVESAGVFANALVSPILGLGSYEFMTIGCVTTPLAATGFQISVFHPTATGAVWIATPNSATTQALYQGPISSDVGTASTGTGPPGTEAAYYAFGTFTVTTADTLRLRLRTEIAASAATLKAGRSLLRWRRIA
jgi:hypothetical protein